MDFFPSASQWGDLGLSVLLVVAAAIIGRWLVTLALDRGVSWLTSRTGTTFDDMIVQVARLPLRWLVIVIAIEIAINRLGFLPQSWDTCLADLAFFLYLLIGFVFVWRLVSNLFLWYGKVLAVRTATKLDEQVMPFFRRIALIVVSAIGLIVLLDHFQVDVSAFVTTLGIGSLAIALAAQATLADMISGFVIMIDRPFRIGDRIEVSELNTWGDVVDVGLRSSRIRTRDNRMVIIPNSVISKSLVVNHSYPDSNYRIQVQVGVAYGSDLEKARQTMIAAVQGVEGVLPDHSVEALFLEFGDSALLFRVRWWIRSYTDTRRMFDRVNTAVYKALTKAGIEIPFPQRDVHYRILAENDDKTIDAFRGD